MLEPWNEDDYWALTDRRGRVLARLEIAGNRLKVASPDKRLQEEVAFLNRHLEVPALRWSSPEEFLLAFASSHRNITAAVQVRAFLS
ncbi:MAG: hypothetical protein FJZ01_12650 [Candidatus Sericytochromatia bacterium]|nr:hypothetical protein [Candidatus Tanganyikabacteria bacterium]